jgi:hypothetical protein
MSQTSLRSSPLPLASQGTQETPHLSPPADPTIASQDAAQTCVRAHGILPTPLIIKNFLGMGSILAESRTTAFALIDQGDRRFELRYNRMLWID